MVQRKTLGLGQGLRLRIKGLGLSFKVLKLTPGTRRGQQQAREKILGWLRAGILFINTIFCFKTWL